MLGMSCWHQEDFKNCRHVLTTSQICHQFLRDLRWKRSLDGQVISTKFSIFPWFPWGFRWFSTGFLRLFGSASDPQILLALRQGEGPGDIELSRGWSNWGEPTHLEGPRFLDLRISRKMGMVHWKNSDYIIDNMYINNDSSSNSNSNSNNDNNNKNDIYILIIYV